MKKFLTIPGDGIRVVICNHRSYVTVLLFVRGLHCRSKMVPGLMIRLRSEVNRRTRSRWSTKIVPMPVSATILSISLFALVRAADMAL